MCTATCPLPDAFEVRFESLFIEGRSLTFPCDENGRVDVDALPPRARHNYQRACALVGREYAHPRVRPALTKCSVDESSG